MVPSSDLSAPTPRRTYLYRALCAHRALLYVGITYDYIARFNNHRDSAGWWADVDTIYITSYPDRQSARIAERWTIKNEHPLWNVQQVDQVDSPTPDEWDDVIVKWEGGMLTARKVDGVLAFTEASG